MTETSTMTRFGGAERGHATQPTMEKGSGNRALLARLMTSCGSTIEAAPGARTGGAGRGVSERSDGERALEFQMKAHGLPAPQREWRFGRALNPPRQFRFDFAWPQLFVAVEVEGGLWVAGRHTRPLGSEDDMVKYSEAAIAGWTVIRVSTGMVTSGAAVAMIKRALQRSVHLGTWPFEQMCRAILDGDHGKAVDIATDAWATQGAFDRGDVVMPEQMTLVPHG